MPPQGEEDVPTKVVSTTAGEETAPPPNEPSPPPGPSKVAVSGGVSKWVIVGVASAVVVSVGLGVGLGVGLTRKNEREAAAAAAAEAEARAQSLVDVASEAGDSATTTIATTDPAGEWEMETSGTTTTTTTAAADRIRIHEETSSSSSSPIPVSSTNATTSLTPAITTTSLSSTSSSTASTSTATTPISSSSSSSASAPTAAETTTPTSTATTTMASTVVATDPATVTTSSSSSGNNDGTTPTATTGSTSSASSSVESTTSTAFDCDPSEDPEESCREVSNYCGGCHCLALHKDELDDYNPLECAEGVSTVACFADPCQVNTRELVCNSDTRKCDWGKPSVVGTTSVPGDDGSSTKETQEAGVDDEGFLSLGSGDLSESQIYSSSDATSSAGTGDGGDGTDGTAVDVNDGLLPWQFRSFSADVLDGYGSCEELGKDLLNAANFLIDRVIERNAKQEYYHMPMPAAGGMDDAAAAAPEAEESSAMDSSASKESVGDGGRGQDEGGETDYGTNNQVDDVDEVDVIKSDGDYVYAAYDDRIYVWEVGTGKIVAETVMPQPEWEEPDREDCRYPHPVEPEPFPVVDEEVDEIVDVEVEVIGRGEEGEGGRGGEEEERIDDQPPPPSLGAASSPSVSVNGAATASASTEENAAVPEKKSMIIDPCYRPYRPRVTVRGLLLPEEGDRLVAFVQGYEGGYPWYPHPWMMGQRDDVEDLRPILSGYGTTHVKVYDTSSTQDVTNDDGDVIRTELVQVSEAELPGQYQNGRSIGTRIHAVTTSNVDTYYHLERHFSRWNEEFQGKSKEDYRKEARKMAGDVAEKFVDRLLEEIKVHHGDDGGSSTCEDIVKLSIFQTGELDPTAHDWWSGRGVLGGLSEVTSFDISKDPTQMDEDGLGVLQAKTATAFVPNSWSTNLYVRDDVLLLATTGYDSHPKLEYVQSTFIYAYRLPGREDAGGAVTSAAKAIGVGKVPGTMINQYSMDLWEDHLRVATTVPARWGCVNKEGKEIDDEPWDWEWSRGCRWERVWGPHNAITVLKVPPRGEPPVVATGGGNEKKWRGLLEETGRTPHLGKPGESITAVRYDEERAYVVTFERIDPFIIVNLTDPTFPNATGELEIPGWSNYLHPVPYTDTVLAVGQHADNVTGRALGLKISLFDTDWYHPDLLASEMAEKALDDDEEEGWQWSSSDVQWDAKAFRYLVQSRVAVLPARINRWTNNKDYREQFCFDGFYFFDVNTEEGNESIRRRFKYDMAEKDKNQYGCYGGGYLPARSMVFDGNAMLFKGDRVHSVNLNSEKRLWGMKLGGSKLPN